MNAEQFFAEPLHFFLGLVGEPGSGKTKQAIGFPRNFYIEIGDTYGLKTVLEDPQNKSLRTNLTEYVSIDIEDKKEAKDIFAPTGEGSIYTVLKRVKEMANDKAIDTLTLDGSSFLFDFKGAEVGKGAGNTEGDRWSYYRQLKEGLTWFVNSNVMPLVSRHKLNVVLCFHVQRESDEAKAKATTRNIDWSPRIEGSFRQSMAALPRAMIYLHQSIKREGEKEKTIYSAYCQRVKVPHVGLIPAKNAYGLPPALDITNKSLYQILVETMNKGKQVTK